MDHVTYTILLPLCISLLSVLLLHIYPRYLHLLIPYWSVLHKRYSFIWFIISKRRLHYEKPTLNLRLSLWYEKLFLHFLSGSWQDLIVYIEISLQGGYQYIEDIICCRKLIIDTVIGISGFYQSEGDPGVKWKFTDMIWVIRRFLHSL